MSHHNPEPFDPAAWLAHWTEAGGGWADRNLMIPQGWHPQLRRMARDLTCAEIIAIAEHLGVEPVE